MPSGFTAFTLFLIIAFIVPGIVFKRFYYQGPFVNQFGVGNFADRIITALLLGMVVQTITYLALRGNFDISEIYTYAKSFELDRNNANGMLDQIQPSSLQLDIDYPNKLKKILAYFFFSIALAGFLGHFWHQVVRRFKLDSPGSVWRFSNSWHYYFTGDDIIKKANKKRHIKKSFLSTKVELYVEEGKDQINKLTGFIADYQITSDGSLDFLFLSAAERTKITPEGVETNEDIPGDCYLVPFKNVRSMSLTFLYQLKKDDSPDAPSKVARWAKYISLLSLPLFLVAPWFTDSEVGKKMVVSAISFIIWILFNVLLENATLRKSRITSPQKKVLFVFLILFVGIAMYELAILPQFLK